MKDLAALVFLAFPPSFMPENKLYEEVIFMPQNTLADEDDLFLGNVTEEDFEAVISKAEAFYTPIVASHGSELVITRNWEDPTVNAYATQVGNQWQVHMFGGLARRPEITKDGFAMVVCHELGHHLGGFPKVADWAANEGQSDYFAAQACARRLWETESEVNAESAAVIPEYPKKLCDSSWKTEKWRNLCYRVSLAGFSLANLLSRGTAKFETPDPRQVWMTNSRHPSGQCRLDTYLAGANCNIRFNNKVIPQSETQAMSTSCDQKRETKGFRPRCWFKPAF